MLKELIQLSQHVAHDVSAIQGAGGNTSIKDDTEMYIKASGILLSEITEQKGWAKVNLAQWREDFKNFTLDIEDDFVLINTKNTLSGGRSSIETGLHALLPHKYVLHSHSAYANVFLCGEKATDKLIEYIRSKEGVDILVVPMCAPGLQLTSYLSDQLKMIPPSAKPIIVLLENHGIAVSCNDFEQTIYLHDLLHNGVRDHFRLPSFPHIDMLEKDCLRKDNATNMLTGNGKVWAIKEICSVSARAFFEDPKIFFPDQIVYVNNKLKREIILDQFPLSQYSILFPNLSRQQAKNTAEILVSVLYLYENIKIPKTLYPSLCEYILNMSGEKYRQNLEQ